MPHHQRTTAELADLHAKIVKLRREGLSYGDITSRLGVSGSTIRDAVRAAKARGEEVPPARESSTRASKTGRLCSGAGRATDGGWL